jgi:hypothetical protein
VALGYKPHTITTYASNMQALVLAMTLWQMCLLRHSLTLVGLMILIGATPRPEGMGWIMIDLIGNPPTYPRPEGMGWYWNEVEQV